jgi:hypothetical protein
VEQRVAAVEQMSKRKSGSVFTASTVVKDRDQQRAFAKMVMNLLQWIAQTVFLDWKLFQLGLCCIWSKTFIYMYSHV